MPTTFKLNTTDCTSADETVTETPLPNLDESRVWMAAEEHARKLVEFLEERGFDESTWQPDSGRCLVYAEKSDSDEVTLAYIVEIEWEETDDEDDATEVA